MASLNDPIIRWWRWLGGLPDPDATSVPSQIRSANDTLSAALVSAGCTDVVVTCGLIDALDGHSSVTEENKAAWVEVKFSGYPKVDTTDWDNNIQPLFDAYDTTIGNGGMSVIAAATAETAEVQ